MRCRWYISYLYKKSPTQELSSLPHPCMTCLWTLHTNYDPMKNWNTVSPPATYFVVFLCPYAAPWSKGGIRTISKTRFFSISLAIELTSCTIGISSINCCCNAHWSVMQWSVNQWRLSIIGFLVMKTVNNRFYPLLCQTDRFLHFLRAPFGQSPNQRCREHP